MQRLFSLVCFVLSLVIPVTSQFFLAGVAHASVCRNIEAELATIGRGPSWRDQQIANRNTVEASRISSHMQSIGCHRQSFLFFGHPPPPECGGYRARLNQLQAGTGVASNNTEGRRRQLMSMLVSYSCRTSPDALPANRSGPLTAGLFDNVSRRSELEVRPDLEPEVTEKPRPRLSGGKAVCVRLCDGYYFPLHVRGASLREDGDDLCRSLCPATDTKMFMMPRSIETAVTTDGDSYTEIPNAFRYRKSFDPSCFCRKPGDMWGENQPSVLNPDGSNQPGFGVINPDQEGLIPEEEADLRGMTHVPGKKRDPRLFGARPPPTPPAPAHPPIELPADRTVPADQGEIKEFRAKDGTTRTVRVVAPELLRAPSEAKAPSIPGRDPSR